MEPIGSVSRRRWKIFIVTVYSDVGEGADAAVAQTVTEFDTREEADFAVGAIKASDLSSTTAIKLYPEVVSG